MAQTAAYLVEQAIPWVPTRQWVVSAPIPLRYWMASSQGLTATVHTITRTTIAQYYVYQAVQQGLPRQKVQSGSVTFMQRFGSALNLNPHWNSWRSWLRSCRCRGSTWCAMGAVWRRTAGCGGRPSPRRANRAWRNRRTGRQRLVGGGHDC